MRLGSSVNGTTYIQDGEVVTKNLKGDSSRIIMDCVLPFIEANKDEPFFTTVWFHTPHEPDLFFGYRRLVEDVNGMAIIRGDFKLLQEAKPEPRLRLYDLSKDPHEKRDLAAEMPNKVQELKKAMLELDESCRLSRDGADYRY